MSERQPFSFKIENMRITVKTGIIVALIWIAVKMLYHFVNPEGSIVPMLFANMFCLLSAIAVGLFLDKKSKRYAKGSAMDDMKAAMQAGIPYAILVVVFIGFYYAKINPEYVDKMATERMTAIQKELDDPVKLKEIKASKEEFQVMTKEEIYKEMDNSTRTVISSQAITLISLLSLTVLSTFYSLLVTIIFRKVLFRG